MISHSDVVEIPLGGRRAAGRVAIVDAADAEIVRGRKWSLAKSGYPQTAAYSANWKRTTILMHRFILNAGKGQAVDHVNHDKLDNRRTNIRVCSVTDNCRNMKLRRNNSTGFTGVSRDHNKSRYRARIRIDGKETYLGSFTTPIDAARAYESAAKSAFGDFHNPQQFREQNRSEA